MNTDTHQHNSQVAFRRISALITKKTKLPKVPFPQYFMKLNFKNTVSDSLLPDLLNYSSLTLHSEKLQHSYK